jgi:hypothetical protein
VLLRELVGARGLVVVVEGDARRADRVAGETVAHGWTNVRVLIGVADLADALPPTADRVFLDDQPVLTGADRGAGAGPGAGALATLLAPLGPADRVAAAVAVPARAADALRELGRYVPALRREAFYLGAAAAVWGQLP